MKRRALAATALLISLAAAPTWADEASGRWAVSGHVAGRDFTLDCKFAQASQRLSGACVDGPTGDAKVKGGRSHALTKGSVNGNKVTFTYQSNYGIIPFGVDYDGVREGDRMSGQLTALGKSGTFTANRLTP
ncbi:MAG: hypothetical protein JWO83_3360 [Caulobacteraceae bacterium]|nr:hypothetical protein [Caulobacteraceae bacterium]